MRVGRLPVDNDSGAERLCCLCRFCHFRIRITPECLAFQSLSVLVLLRCREAIPPFRAPERALIQCVVELIKDSIVLAAGIMKAWRSVVLVNYDTSVHTFAEAAFAAVAHRSMITLSELSTLPLYISNALPTSSNGTRCVA